MGVFRKGRTSSSGLLYLARRLAALCMGYQVRLSLRYVPSAKNLADGPSRGMRTPGVAPETLLKTSSGRSARTQRFDDNCGFPGEGPSTGKTSSGRSARTQRFDSTLGYPGEGPPKGGRRKTPPPPLKNRGRFVWDQVAHTGLPPGRAAGSENFLHAHAVSHGTLVIFASSDRVPSTSPLAAMAIGYRAATLCSFSRHARNFVLRVGRRHSTRTQPSSWIFACVSRTYGPPP